MKGKDNTLKGELKIGLKMRNERKGFQIPLTKDDDKLRFDDNMTKG